MTASRTTGRLGGLRRAAGIGIACAACLAGLAWAQSPSATDAVPPGVEIDEAALDALGPPVRRGIAAPLALRRPGGCAPCPPSALARPGGCDTAAVSAIGPDGLPIYDAAKECLRSRTIGLPMRSGANVLPAVRLHRPGAAETPEPRAPEDDTPPPPATQEHPPPRPSAVAPPAPPGSAVEAAEAEEAPAAAAPLADPFAAPLSVPFDSGDSDLPPAARPTLDEVARSLDADPAGRIQLKAYADAAGTTSSAARRMSMLRALSVRSYLMDAGVASTRIDVRALGAKYESGPPDRVDIVGVR